MFSQPPTRRSVVTALAAAGASAASDGPSLSARARCDPPILGTCSGNGADCWVVDVDAQQAAQSFAPVETRL